MKGEKMDSMDYIITHPKYDDGTTVEVGDHVLNEFGRGFVVNRMAWFWEKPENGWRYGMCCVLSSGHGYSLKVCPGETVTRATDKDMKEYFKKWPGEKQPRTPTVYIGDVHPLPKAVMEDKEWPKKVLEEAAEVYSAWEDWREAYAKEDEAEERSALRRIVLECGDVIQTCANLVYAARKEGILPDEDCDMVTVMGFIEGSNRRKGRYE